jgi:hypothetical protein
MASSNASNTYRHTTSITSVRIIKKGILQCVSKILSILRCHARSVCLYCSIAVLRSLLHRTLDQIPDLLPDLNPIFKKRETKGKSGEKWRWREGELQAILEDYIYRA